MGTLSSTDVRGVSAENIDDLLFPVAVYLQMRGHSRRGAVAMSQHAPLREVMITARVAHVHRIWCVSCSLRE